MTDRHIAARALLDQAAEMGVTVADLIAASTPSPAPTLADYVSAVGATFSPGTARTYTPFLRLAAELLGDRCLDQLTVTDLHRVVDEAVTRARRRRPDSTGRSSQENTVAALRALFARAIADGHVAHNPALGLTKPRRARSRRRALTDDEVTDLIDAIRTTSRDPALDLLLVRFHLESGARRQGALNLRLRDLDPNRATAWLREKDDTEREPPISPGLGHLLHDHATSRGATCSIDAVFRTRNGTAMTERRYSTIFDRPDPASPGRSGHRSPPTCCATPPSPPSGASPATPSPKPSPATPHPR